MLIGWTYWNAEKISYNIQLQAGIKLQICYALKIFSLHKYIIELFRYST